MPQFINCGYSFDSRTKLATISNIKVGRVISAKFSNSNESTIDIDNHADKTVLGLNCLPIHDFEISIDVSG